MYTRYEIDQQQRALERRVRAAKENTSLKAQQTWIPHRPLCNRATHVIN
ncbi:MAG: hypothetical protein ACLR7U_06420 [Ruthenibacterium lactatiformans]